MSDPDNIFDTGLAAIVGSLGIAAGWLLSGELAFPMYCALAGVGLGMMLGGIVLRDWRFWRQHAETERQFEFIRANLPREDEPLVRVTLAQLVEDGREAHG